MTKNARGAAICFLNMQQRSGTATEDHYSVSAGERPDVGAALAPHMGKAHRQITSAFDLDIQFREAQMHSPPPTNIMHSQ
jgi:hypothetical protein